MKDIWWVEMKGSDFVLKLLKRLREMWRLGTPDLTIRRKKFIELIRKGR